MAQQLWLLCYLPLLLLLHSADAANILAVLPSIWKSHYIFGSRLLQQLAVQHNHTITLISPHAVIVDGDGDNGMRQMSIKGLANNWLEMGLSFNPEQLRQKSIMERFTRLMYAGTANVDLLLSDQQVRQLLRSKQTFDLFVVDLFLSDALLGLSLYYNAPTVVLSPTGANAWLNQMLGNPQSFALDPSNFLPYSERMNIWQRSINTLMVLFEKLTNNFFHMNAQQSVYDKHFSSLCQRINITTLPHHRELTKNLSLVLLNSNPVLQYPRAYLPNMLEVAGAHLSTAPAEELQLPKHLLTFLDNAPAGVVYLSLGADMQTSAMAHDKFNAILDVFAYLSEMSFLIKWELEDFPTELPANILISAWFPQEAVLAHANVKVFISSCGLMSVMEAINGLTPILAIAIHPEQEVMAQRLVNQQVALAICYDDITFDTLLFGIKQVAQNQSFVQQMQQLRAQFWSGYGKPLDKALHYISLILQRNAGGAGAGAGGVAFLQSHANQLNFLRAELFDVLAIIAFGVFSIFAVPFLIIRCILRHYYTQSSNYHVAWKAGNVNRATVVVATVRQQRVSGTNSSDQSTASSSCSSSNGSPITVNAPAGAFAISAAAAQKLLINPIQAKTLQHCD